MSDFTIEDIFRPYHNAVNARENAMDWVVQERLRIDKQYAERLESISVAERLHVDRVKKRLTMMPGEKVAALAEQISLKAESLYITNGRHLRYENVHAGDLVVELSAQRRNEPAYTRVGWLTGMVYTQRAAGCVYYVTTLDGLQAFQWTDAKFIRVDPRDFPPQGDTES